MARHNGPATEAKASGRSSANWQNDKLGRRPNDRWTSGGRLLGRRHGQGGLGFLPLSELSDGRLLKSGRSAP